MLNVLRSLRTRIIQFKGDIAALDLYITDLEATNDKLTKEVEEQPDLINLKGLSSTRTYAEAVTGQTKLRNALEILKESGLTVRVDTDTGTATITKLGYQDIDFDNDGNACLVHRKTLHNEFTYGHITMNGGTQTSRVRISNQGQIFAEVAGVWARIVIDSGSFVFVLDGEEA